MSSRRKGKPQQRKKIETLEPEQDYITCGDCQREFVLSDIVRFIQHKVNRCNKENVEPDFPNNTDYGDCDDEDPVSSVISSRRTSVSISAPIREKLSPKPSLVPTTQHDLPPLRDKASPEDITNESDCGSSSNNGELETNPEGDDEKPRYIDAEANTVYSEPSSFICGTCKSEYSSSWFLMQHAQTKHSLKIYMDPAVPSPPNSLPDRLASTQPVLSSEKDADSLLLNTQRDATPTSQSSLSMHSKTPPQQSPQRQSSPGGSSVFSPTATSPFLMGSHRPSIPAPFGPPPFNRPLGMSPDYPAAPRFDLFPPPAFGGLSSGDHPVSSDLLRQLGQAYGASTVMDFSHRLRQLAQPDPRKGFGAESSAFNPPSSRSGSTGMGMDSPSKMGSSSSSSQRLKACEFCGKSFRFPSNLIVHRRSHTGEKPYKCPLCPHACSQASKLKRHMKTHNKALFAVPYPSGTPDGSVRSSTSTPDSKMSKLDEDEETDEEDLDEETAAAREAEAEEELRQLHLQVAAAAAATRDQERPTDLSQGKSAEPGTGDTDVKSTSTEEEPKDLSAAGKMSRASLLQEMMEQTPLGAIEQYKEAYDAAMAENSGGSEEDGQEEEDMEEDDDDDREDSLMNGLDDDDVPEEKLHLKMASQSDVAEDEEEDPKPIKIEPVEESGASSPGSSAASNGSKQMRLPPYLDPAFSRAYTRDHPASLYPIWFPPPHNAASEMYLGQLMSGDLQRRHANFLNNPLTENGLGQLPSALKNGGSKPCSTSLNAMVRRPVASSGSGSNSIPGIPPTRRRNDTCEFCGKIFRNCSNLTVHRRSHTGEKPYKCRMCSYACAQSSKLTRHMRTHGRYGKDVYKCKFCHMPFSVPSTLEKHMRKCVENRNGRAVMMDDGVLNHNSPSIMRPLQLDGPMPPLVSPLGSPLAMGSALSSANTSPVLNLAPRVSMPHTPEEGITPTSSPLSASPTQSLTQSLPRRISVGSPVPSSPLPSGPGLDMPLTTVSHPSPAVGTA